MVTATAVKPRFDWLDCKRAIEPIFSFVPEGRTLPVHTVSRNQIVRTHYVKDAGEAARVIERNPWMGILCDVDYTPSDAAELEDCNAVVPRSRWGVAFSITRKQSNVRAELLHSAASWVSESLAHIWADIETMTLRTRNGMVLIGASHRLGGLSIEGAAIAEARIRRTALEAIRQSETCDTNVEVNPIPAIPLPRSTRHVIKEPGGVSCH